MRRRFIVWAIVAGVLLGSSSVVGMVVKAVVAPKEHDWRATPGFARPFPAATATRAELVNAQPTAFGVPEAVAQADAPAFQQIFDGMAAAVGQGNIWGTPQYFDFDRMAEE